MKKVFKFTLSGLCVAGLLLTGCSATAEKKKTDVQPTASGYAAHPQAQAFIAEMEKEGFSPSYVTSVLSQARRQESILKAMSRPAEKRLNWGEYRSIFIQPKRVNQGVKFWNENRTALERAEKEYGVPSEIIVAIIGVETRYGRITGSYRVIDALATLGFDYPKRSKFFLGQFKEYLHLVREEKVEFTSLKGSYAGAMGYGQFIPSSFRNFAVDFDGDGQRDIWKNKTDAIGSVANYFARHHWKAGEEVVSSVVFNNPAQDEWFSKGLKPELTLAQWKEKGVSTQASLPLDSPATLMRMTIKDGEQYWFGLHNFYVITRYNHSRLYAMAVFRLSEQIKAAKVASDTKNKVAAK